TPVIRAPWLSPPPTPTLVSCCPPTTRLLPAMAATTAYIPFPPWSRSSPWAIRPSPSPTREAASPARSLSRLALEVCWIRYGHLSRARSQVPCLSTRGSALHQPFGQPKAEGAG